MPDSSVYDQVFDRSDLPLSGEYENCTFNNCDFSGGNFSRIVFIDCRFNGCNFSLVKLNQVVFRDVYFRDCKMLGLRFETCNEYGLSFSFDNCQLGHSSFYKMKIRKTIFKNSQLQETDFPKPI